VIPQLFAQHHNMSVLWRQTRNLLQVNDSVNTWAPAFLPQRSQAGPHYLAGKSFL